MLDVRIQTRILKLHRKIFPFPRGWMNATGPEAAALLKNRLLDDQPCLIGRFGSIEMEAIMAYLHRNRRMMPLERLYRFASWDVRYIGWKPALKAKLLHNAGFFPPKDDQLNRFAELYMGIAPQIDILGSWIHAETLLREQMPNTLHIPISDLDPYMTDSPWSKALEGKKVLVIHPFTTSIPSQFSKRKSLFSNPDVLPEFDLITLKPVQSSGGAKVPFSNWFQALESMKSQTDQLEFDIAIIGAGAYGLPLAAHIKARGKKAVHLGGVTQLLFGIYGNRWENDPKIKRLINDSWIRPPDVEKPDNFRTIENGCYW